MAFDLARFSALLKTESLGRKVFHFGSLPSSMDTAFELAAQGAPPGSLIIADEQTAGRGRRGRDWLSHKDCGLWFSLMLRPPHRRALIGLVSPATALTLAMVLQEDLGLPARTKWPNDVRLRGRKIAGVLVETRRQPRAMVIGIGLNLRLPSALPPELAEQITALEAECTECPAPENLLANILYRLEGTVNLCHCGAAAPLVTDWQEYDDFYQQQVEVKVGAQTIVGTDLGISHKGHLLLETTAGLKAVSGGEITTLRPE